MPLTLHSQSIYVLSTYIYQIMSSYEEMAAVLPEEVSTKDGVPYNCGWSYGRSYELKSSPKVASRDGILHRFHPYSTPRDPWLIKNRLGEDKTHIEPLDGGG
jgi:hypothetical protein